MNPATLYTVLVIAIVFEVLGTSAMQAAQHFTRLTPTVLMVFVLRSRLLLPLLCAALHPVGIAYALWSGLGIVLISIAGYVVFGQKLDLPAILGLALIIAGVLVLNLFSKSTFH